MDRNLPEEIRPTLQELSGSESSVLPDGLVPPIMDRDGRFL